MELIGRRAILFTDIEGSTSLFQRVGDRYGDLLDAHHQILRDAIRSSDGEEVVSEGDAFVATFEDVDPAVDAALRAQLDLHRHPWPDGGTVKVRMGVHTGDLARSESGLIGMALHETARISAAAHGGQILASEEVAASVRETAERRGIGLIGLGEFELKDLGRTPLVQLTHPDLPHDFPPPHASVLGQNNLPGQLDDLVGRVDERRTISALLTDHRLVTLVGSGGVGKSRLALAVAADLVAAHPGGVWLVDLADRDPETDLVGATAAAVGVGAGPDTLARLTDQLRHRRTLIVLDNCEHLLGPAATLVGTLTRSCPRLHVLATSQEPLGLTGEMAWRVPSMSPADASSLFRRRMASVRPSLDETAEETRLIQRICRRLDGIPLAIELAAARCRTMSIRDVDDRLADRFRLLRGGGVDVSARHQTLLATVDWSFGLLGERERTVAARMSVFRGGADLDAIEEVCSDDLVSEQEIDDLVDVLNAKSIMDVEVHGRRTRLRFPETIRQYAADRLVESGDFELLADRHADYFADLARRAGEGWRSPDRGAWIRRCTIESENLGAACDRLERHDPDRAASIVCSLHIWLTGQDHPAWIRRIQRLSGRTDLSPETAADVDALRALLAEGYGLEGSDVASEHALRAVDGLEAVTDPLVRLRVMANAAVGLRGQHLPLAIELSERALAEARELGDRDATAVSMYDLMLLRPEDDPGTRALRTELLDGLDPEQPRWWEVVPLVDEALDAHHHGEYDRTRHLLDRAERILATVDAHDGAVTDASMAFAVWSCLIRAEQGDTDGALLIITDALARVPAEAEHLRRVLHSTHGHALQLAGRVGEAREAFELAVDRIDGWRYLVHAVATVGLATIAVDEHRTDEARAMLAPIVDDPHRQGWLRARAHDVLAAAAFLDRADADGRTHLIAADELNLAGDYVVPPALAERHESLRVAP
ncbi:MAG: adenylate/guanylate cyclase domain-containing protein [Ilumatobacter sp.]|nr:adenylate/guanylate cyclase domain-containing protein [Ilumatobacter sp.]